MAYKKGLPRPQTECRHNFVTLSGEPLKTLLKIKELHRQNIRYSKHMNKGHIANRMICDYVAICATLDLQTLFEVPYTIPQYRSHHKIELGSGHSIVVSSLDNKVVNSLTMQIYLQGKALELVNLTREYMIERNIKPHIPTITAYYIERLQALTDQRKLDYIEFYKKNYRLA